MADEGYISGTDLSGPAVLEHEKPKLGLTYKADARNDEIPDEVEDEKPEREFEDPDDEITYPDWYYPEDKDKDFPNARYYDDDRTEVNEFFKRNERL